MNSSKNTIFFANRYRYILIDSICHSTKTYKFKKSTKNNKQFLHYIQ